MSENNERRIVGHVAFHKGLYEIAAHDKEYIIRLRELGVEIEKPSTEIYYSDLYKLDNDSLILENIRIENCWGTFRVINGVRAAHSCGAIIYNMVNLPVEYTGTIILKRGSRQIGGEHSLINELFGCRELYRITLNKGKVAQSEDMSVLCDKIEHLEKSKSKLTDTQSTSHLQELFLRDYSKEAVPKGWELYKYYEEYFNEYNC